MSNTQTLAASDVSELAAAHERAKAALRELDAQAQALPGQLSTAIATGDVDGFVALRQSRRELDDRLRLTRLVHARAGLAWARALYAALWQRDELALEARKASLPEGAPTHYQLDTGSMTAPTPQDTSLAAAHLTHFQEAVKFCEREVMS